MDDILGANDKMDDQMEYYDDVNYNAYGNETIPE